METNGTDDWNDIKLNGDKAFEQLFKGNYRSLCNFAFSFLKDRDDAEDVVQQMFFTLFKKKQELEIHTTLKSYLFSSVKNACLNHLRHVQVRTEHLAEQMYFPQIVNSTSNQVIGNELEKKIEHALDQLPDQCGLVFKMSRFGNMKYKEIADELNISVKTVENHMGKALKLMRVSLRDYMHILMIISFNYL